jgi:hypothetical protein
MSDMDHRDLDEDAPEFERQGLKPRSEPEEEPEPDPARPRAKTSSGDADEP